jgi:hypothetical protein
MVRGAGALDMRELDMILISEREPKDGYCNYMGFPE